ncbi:helix-turn-helix domain-containing protein [Streptomyces pristinaespiralis]|uniref:helix-turn-helix domain-containing protein n=2 Tax=Streptomyces pristinaespiralis TaxID=38300 RepID=UPI0033BFC0B4
MDFAGSGAPDPERVRDPAEFVAAMQALKDRSGLTYRELTSRAEAVGDVLPRSTVANMLGRTTLPREELVAAFVRACGAGPGELDAWLRLRKELTRRERAAVTYGATDAGHGGPGPALTESGRVPRSGDEAAHPAADGASVIPRTGPPPAAAGPAPNGPRRRRRLLTAAVAAVVVAAAVTAAALHFGGGTKTDTGAAEVSGPAPGPVQIRAVSSGLCLAEQGGQNGQLYQQPCSPDSIPRFSLKRLGTDWRLETFHTTFGWGCSGVQEKSTEAGAPVEDQECGKRGPAEAFRVEPVGEPVRGYRLRPVHSGLCAGVEAADSEKKGADIRQLGCTDDGTGQLFSFDPVPGPS